MKRPFAPLSLAICCLFAAFLAQSDFCRGADKFAYGDISGPEFFPILPWDPYHGWAKPNLERSRADGLQSIADCDFNMTGFVLPRDLRECRKLGLSAIMLWTDPAFTNVQYIFEWRKLSDAQIDRKVRDQVAAAGSNPAVKGFFITDEPGALDFPALAKAVAAVKKYAPGKFAYINLFPEYATLGAPDISQLGTPSYTEYLERFVNEVHPQFLSYDNYMVEFSNDLKNRGQVAVYFHNLLEVRRVARAHRLPYLNIVSANQIRPDATPPSPANLALQAYTTLAAGYRGVTWYTYYSQGYKYAPVDSDGHKTAVWTYLQAINSQIMALAPIMCRLQSTGVYFTEPPADNCLPLPGNLIESATSTAPLMIGEFRGQDAETYVMVVNLSLETSVRFNIKTRGSGASFPLLKVVSPVDRSLADFDAKTGYWLPAGQGILLKLTQIFPR